MEFALEVKGLRKTYKEFGLKNISMKLPKGCVLGLIGENGAGKSTLINAILGLIECDYESLRIFGQEYAGNEKQIKEEIAVIFDKTCYDLNFTPLFIGKILSNVYSNWDMEKYHGYLKRFGLPEDKRLKTFSKGMKMKLAIAVALSHHAKLLILDEPTSGLDPFMRDEILDILYEFTRAEDQSVLISSHIVSDLERLCDYIAYIDQGSLKLYEEKDRLIEQYGILKCSKEELKEFDEQAVKGVRKNSYGVEALVDKLKMPKDYKTDMATLEEIIVFLSKGQEE